ncbi:MAG: RsmB/NOP family class I SAM-dependent RNA methyltransferase [Alphaproteobacteria bacterium]
MSQPDQKDLYADRGTEEPQNVEMLSARQAALNIMDAVLGRKQQLDLALEDDAIFKNLPSRDRAFTRMLVSTTLRRLGQIDDLITRAEEKPGSRNTTLTNILRLGITQILFMDVPNHAAVDTSVRLAEAARMERQKGFVNGLLRTITRQGKDWMARQDEGRLNTPDWLLRIWISDYGLGRAAQIAKANLREAPLDITVKNGASVNHWAATLKAISLNPFTLRREAGGAVSELPGYEDGMWWIQDGSAAIPAHLFGDVAGKTVVDLCAAPGGKTAQLAALGAHVIAVDRSAQRVKKLEQNLQRLRLGEHVKMVASDATVWSPQQAPQFILCDVPCTATGTLRRHPDVAYLKLPRDLEQLVGVQARILENAFRILAPGGILIYCVCSLQKVEGEEQIQHLIDMQPSAVKLPITPEEIGGMEELVTENGDLRILPFHKLETGGMDGFFISRLMKSG